MQTHSIRLAVCTALLFASLPVLAEPQDGQKIKDWTVECQTVPKPEAKLDVKVQGSEEGGGGSEEKAETAPAAEITVCQIVQTLTEKSADKPVLQVAIGYLPEQDMPVASFVLPLGVFLPAGLQLRVDEGKSGRVPFVSCDPVGCHAGVELDAEFLASMKQGNQLNVTFGTPNRQGVTAPVSLQGFTAALDSLKN
jgi:invasion protein IalB